MRPPPSLPCNLSSLTFLLTFFVQIRDLEHLFHLKLLLSFKSPPPPCLYLLIYFNLLLLFFILIGGYPAFIETTEKPGSQSSNASHSECLSRCGAWRHRPKAAVTWGSNFRGPFLTYRLCFISPFKRWWEQYAERVTADQLCFVEELGGVRNDFLPQLLFQRLTTLSPWTKKLWKKHIYITTYLATTVISRASLVAQLLRFWVRPLGWEDPLEEGKATHSSILAWRIPWTEELVRLQSMGLQRVRHDWM